MDGQFAQYIIVVLMVAGAALYLVHALYRQVHGGGPCACDHRARTHRRSPMSRGPAGPKTDVSAEQLAESARRLALHRPPGDQTEPPP